ncbi:MAG: peptidylprolyl isomerase [Coriobacteriales bacterium]|jgi:peptidyl-prolyl cis-trans isomerase B (cyclophilin B)|nr:peptidylprolyl isomerase [Coriobacteriales bacterium]
MGTCAAYRVPEELIGGLMSDLYTPEYVPSGAEKAIFHTNKGDITVQLAGKDAPVHVGNFIELAEKGFYEGLKFHRYEPGFVIQGGCPNSREYSSEELARGAQDYSRGIPGTGGPGYSIKGEWLSNPHNEHKDGTLAMARSQMPDSAGSQFYFCLGAQSFLDSNYTVFGAPFDEESLKIIHTLAKGDIIKSIEITDKEA